MTGKFNKKVPEKVAPSNRSNATRNYGGALAFKPSPKTDLTLRYLTYLVGEPKFYEKPEQDIKEITKLILKVAKDDPEYILKLASYARNEMYLRSAPIYSLVIASQIEDVKPYVRKWTPNIINRVDELTEAISALIVLGGEIGSGGKNKIPNSLKKGIADAFHKFDEYQFAKYDKDEAVKLRDVARLVHPKPKTEEQASLFKRIVERNLRTPDTWEVTTSVFGSTKESWSEIAPKMGYMAKLRNLNNFLKHGVDVTPIVEHLTNPNAVRRSKQYPFRFLSAKKAVESSRLGDPFSRQRIIEALETAMDISVANFPHFGGRTLIACDNSGSMSSRVSGMSDMQAKELANLLGAMAHSISDEGLGASFADRFEIANLSKRDGILTNAKKIQSLNTGGGTTAVSIFEYLLNNKVYVDRIILLSDMQCYGRESYGGGLVSYLRRYKREINPNVILYSWDLVGYGTTKFPEDEPNVVLMAGWADKALEFCAKYETFGDGTIVQIIDSYVPPSLREDGDEE